MTLRRITFAILTTMFSTGAFGAYQNTHWGMSLAELQTLYPRGTRAESSSGRLTYLVAGTGSKFRNALVSFRFGAAGGLADVTVAFADSVDGDAGTVVALNRENADQSYRDANAQLTEELGEPTAATRDTRQWQKNGDGIALVNFERGDDRRAVAIRYEPAGLAE